MSVTSWLQYRLPSSCSYISILLAPREVVFKSSISHLHSGCRLLLVFECLFRKQRLLRPELGMTGKHLLRNWEEIILEYLRPVCRGMRIQHLLNEIGNGRNNPSSQRSCGYYLSVFPKRTQCGIP